MTQVVDAGWCRWWWGGVVGPGLGVDVPPDPVRHRGPHRPAVPSTLPSSPNDCATPACRTSRSRTSPSPTTGSDRSPRRCSNNWSALLEHLNDPLARPDHLTKSLHLLATYTADIPTELIPELSTAVEQMLKRPDHAWSLTNFEAIAKWTCELLREFTRSRDDGRLFALLREPRPTGS